MDPSLELDLQLAGRGSRLASLHGALREAIASGRLAPGLRLPASRELASQVGVSRNTAVAAYELLSSEGWLESRGAAHARLQGRARGHRSARIDATNIPAVDAGW